MKELNKLGKIILLANTIDEVMALWYSRVQIDLAFRESIHLWHYTFNWILYKRCGKCRETKTSDNYWENKATKSWLKSYCRDCQSRIEKIRKVSDKKWAEKERLRKQEYKVKNREQIRKREREKYHEMMQNLTTEQKYKLRLRWRKANNKRKVQN